VRPLSGKDAVESGEDRQEDGGDNPFPEAEIDDMRAVRDAALARYVQVGLLALHSAAR
jgi:hypothetical protein